MTLLNLNWINWRGRNEKEEKDEKDKKEKEKSGTNSGNKGNETTVLTIMEEGIVRMKEIRTIDLVEIARLGKIGPITLGSRLSDFANEVGPPARWGDFSDKTRLSCLMVFGEVEVGFEAGEGDLLVTWAKINMSRFVRS